MEGNTRLLARHVLLLLGFFFLDGLIDLVKDASCLGVEFLVDGRVCWWRGGILDVVVRHSRQGLVFVVWSW